MAALPAAKSEWANLLEKVIAVEQDTKNNSVAQALEGFFSSYAATTTLAVKVFTSPLRATLNKPCLWSIVSKLLPKLHGF